MDTPTNNMEDTEDKTLNEWKLDQIFKLQAEIAAFTKQTMPTWLDVLNGKCVEVADSTLSDDYMKMWLESWTSSRDLVEKCKKEQQNAVSWLLDKRANLRQELEEYGKTDYPEMKKALGESEMVLAQIDEAWRNAWKVALKLVSPQ